MCRVRVQQQAKKEEIENEMLYGAKKRKNVASDITGALKTPSGAQAKRAKVSLIYFIIAGSRINIPTNTYMLTTVV